MKDILITSSVLIAAVTAVRFAFRNKISRRLQYALWGLVLLRLLLPVPLPQASFSVLSGARMLSAQWQPPVSREADTPAAPESGSAAAGSVQPSAAAPALPPAGPAPAAPDSASPDVLTVIWLTVAGLVLLWFLGANLSLSRRLKRTRVPCPQPGFRLPVYVTGAIVSPCLFGLFRPAVYLTPKAAASPDSLRHVLTHELCHFRHGDHIWSLLRGLCLSLYWFDPLVWAAAILSRADSELACDEAAIRALGAEHRLGYGKTLVDMIAVRRSPSGVLCAATTMTSGKRSIRERLNRIVKNPGTAWSAAVAVVLITAVCVGCTFTDAKSHAGSGSTGAANLLTPAEPGDPASETGFSGDGDVYRQHFCTDGSIQGVVVYVEAWKNGEPAGICGAAAASLEPGEGTLEIWRSVTGSSGWTSAEFQLAPGDGSVSACSVALPQDLNLSAMGTSWLGGSSTENEFAITPDQPIILLCSPFQAGEQSGLSVYDCTFLMEQPDRLAEYAYALVVRAVFTSGDPFSYQPEQSLPSSYEVHLVQNGAEIPVAGYPGALPEELLMDAMAKSAAWPAEPLPAVYFRIRQYPAPDGEASDHYVYRLAAGTAVLQSGGFYSVVSDELLQALEKAAGVRLGIYDLDAALSQAILQENRSGVRDGEYLAESHITLGVTENAGSVTAYCMVMFLSFTGDETSMEQSGAGGHFPAAITFDKDGTGAYVLSEYWTPGDGSDYASSIRQAFPADLSEAAMDTQKYALSQMQSCYAQAIAHFAPDLTRAIETRLDLICSSPAEASNPGAYVAAHAAEYRELLCYGDNTLEYVFRQFLEGGQTGLRGAVMNLLMEDLLGGENIGTIYSTGQEYFDQWKAHVLQLYDRNPLSYFAEYAPKSYLLLQVLGLTGAEGTADAAAPQDSVDGIFQAP